jgi:hypothetical protein
VVTVYDWLRREAYFGIADESHKRGIPFVGHIPFSITAIECSDAGQKSVEHDYPILNACKDGYEAWRQQVIHAANPRTVGGLNGGRTFDIRRADPIIERFRKNRTWLCPTLSISLGISRDRILTISLL